MASRILVPLDGSTLAEHALPCATALAQELPAELILLRAVSVPPDLQELLENMAPETPALVQRLKSQAQDYLQKISSQLEETGLDVHMTVRQGPAAETIVNYIQEKNVQQIVMSTHGYSGISRWTHGSVAERVLQSADVPVLLVHAKSRTTSKIGSRMSCERILVPLDGSSIAEQVLPPATSIGRALKARIILFRVPIVQVASSLLGEWHMPVEGVFETAEQDAQIYLDQVAKRLRTQSIQVSTAMRIGGVANAIVEYAEVNDIDLIAMCTHGRTGLARWALGSVADRVLRASQVPLLLVRAR